MFVVDEQILSIILPVQLHSEIKEKAKKSPEVSNKRTFIHTRVSSAATFHHPINKHLDLASGITFTMTKHYYVQKYRGQDKLQVTNDYSAE